MNRKLQLVVRVRTSYFTTLTGLHYTKAIVTMKSLSNGCDFVRHDCSQREEEEVFKSIVNINSVEDGLYTVEVSSIEDGIGKATYILVPYNS